jgi:hypothetical protein
MPPPNTVEAVVITLMGSVHEVLNECVILFSVKFALSSIFEPKFVSEAFEFL